MVNNLNQWWFRFINMTNLKDRIQELVDELSPLGVDQVDIAKAAGVTKGTVTQWLTGDIKSLKLEYALGIEGAFGFRAIWLVLGKGPKLVSDMTATSVASAEAWPFSAPYSDYLALPKHAKERLNDKVSDFIEGAIAATSHADKRRNARTGTSN